MARAPAQRSTSTPTPGNTVKDFLCIARGSGSKLPATRPGACPTTYKVRSQRQRLSLWRSRSIEQVYCDRAFPSNSRVTTYAGAEPPCVRPWFFQRYCPGAAGRFCAVLDHKPGAPLHVLCRCEPDVVESALDSSAVVME